MFTPANTLVDIETVAVNGNGSYSTPVGFLPTSAGTYQWDVTYSGDGNNKSASEVNATNEQQSVVGAPEPGSLLLLGTGLVGGIGAKRRRFPK